MSEAGDVAQGNAGPPAEGGNVIRTINALTTETPLSEEDLFCCRLAKPQTKIGNHSFPKSRDGSIPYDPEKVVKVSLEEFLQEHTAFKGSEEKVQNTLPPVDWGSRLFSEDDDRSELRNKVYLPLSRVLKPRGITFGQDTTSTIHREGSEDTAVMDTGTPGDQGTVRVVIEEKSESMIRSLMDGAEGSFADFCILGRKKFLLGAPTNTEQPGFACPLFLAQLLGYMYSSKVCRGIVFTSGRAIFVWIEIPTVEEPAPAEPVAKRPRVAKTTSVSAQSSDTTRKIFVTEEMFIDHPDFLRVVASFLGAAFKINYVEGAAAAQLLGVTSDEGGFQRGLTQKHAP